MDLRTITARVLSRHQSEKRARANLVRRADRPGVPQRLADDAPLTPGVTSAVGVGVIPGRTADRIGVLPAHVDVDELGLRDRRDPVVDSDEALHSTSLDDRHRAGAVGRGLSLGDSERRPAQPVIELAPSADYEEEWVDEQSEHRLAGEYTEIERHGEDYEGRDGGWSQAVDGDGERGHREAQRGKGERDVPSPAKLAMQPMVLHGGIVAANDPPSPINQSALSVNPVGYDLGLRDDGRNDGSSPFIFDRGTQTVHVAPEGTAHGQMLRMLGDKIQGPLYNGWQDGYGIDYHSAPSRADREAIEKLMQRHTGKPLKDDGLYGTDDQFSLYSRRRKIANKCSVCGDLLAGVDCPRCNWGGWNNAQDNTKNPSDPTVDMSRGIQAKVAAHGLIPCPDCGGDIEHKSGHCQMCGGMGQADRTPYSGQPTGEPCPLCHGSGSGESWWQCAGCHRTWDDTDASAKALLPKGINCPKCNEDMHWRDGASLGGMWPEGAWECSNQRCWHMLAPGQMAPSTYTDPDSGSSGLTLPEHWGAPQPPEWQPGTEGKGLLDWRGQLHTWQGDTPHEMYRAGRPFRDARAILYIKPDGYVSSYDGSLDPSILRQVQSANPNLHQNQAEDFRLAAQPWFYHVAPTSARQSILDGGLMGHLGDHTISPSPWEEKRRGWMNFDPNNPQPPGNYLFSDIDDARDYAVSHPSGPNYDTAEEAQMEAGGGGVGMGDDGRWYMPRSQPRDWNEDTQGDFYDSDEYHDNPDEPFDERNPDHLAELPHQGFDIWRVHPSALGNNLLPDPEQAILNGGWLDPSDAIEKSRPYAQDRETFEEPEPGRMDWQNWQPDGGTPLRWYAPGAIPSEAMRVHEWVPPWAHNTEENMARLDDYGDRILPQDSPHQDRQYPDPMTQIHPTTMPLSPPPQSLVSKTFSRVIPEDRWVVD